MKQYQPPNLIGRLSTSSTRSDHSLDLFPPRRCLLRPYNSTCNKTSARNDNVWIGRRLLHWIWRDGPFRKSGPLSHAHGNFTIDERCTAVSAVKFLCKSVDEYERRRKKRAFGNGCDLLFPRWCTGPGFLLRHPILKLQSYHTVQAIPRECTGNRVSARDRAQGRIPAVVFAQILLDKNPSSRSLSRKQLLTSERKQIQCILKSVDLPFFCSTTFPLQIRAGSGSSVLLEPGNVLPVKIHRDAETGKILNLVFVWADEGTELKVDVPVVFRGQEDCPGLKKGGALNMIRTSLRFLCPAEYIPQKIEVDVSNLDVGDRIFMRDIEIHTSLKLLSKNENMPVCKIVPTTLKNAEPAIEEELKHDAGNTLANFVCDSNLVATLLRDC
ncbi:50S ribosomal protein L25-like [Tripterygium wilfordii]|uniref:50S ribosomal protein L25-like n=1 Tax=Tripterygium wilfordii TaxID=458696 RepID=UPI0018F84DD7|nr:50S ribosomal protein L25-like [Tripterygium wilfordii]